MSAHPYRDAPPVDLGEAPWCFHRTNIENKQAMGAIGGWWHEDKCIEWHRQLQQRDPKDPRLAEFLKTCEQTLRESFK